MVKRCARVYEIRVRQQRFALQATTFLRPWTTASTGHARARTFKSWQSEVDPQIPGENWYALLAQSESSREEVMTPLIVAMRLDGRAFDFAIVFRSVSDIFEWP